MDGIKIRSYVERNETDIIEYQLTPEEYAEFEKQRKILNTSELGQWLADTVKKYEYWDSYGTDPDVTSILDVFNDETIQD